MSPRVPLHVLALLACFASTAASQSPGAMFRGGPSHPGSYPASGPRSAPRVAWRFHTGGRVFGSPAVVGATVYIGSTDANVYALDRATGGLRWKTATGGRVTSTPVVAGGRVYLVSYDGRLYALDAGTGAVAWTFRTAGERRFTARHLHGFAPDAESMPDPFDIYLSSPVVWRDLVVFGSGDGHVYGVDASSGRLRWSYLTGDVVHASPAVAGGTVYIGSWDGWLYALDAAKGTLRWKLRTGQDDDIHNQVGFQSSAAVMDGVVYVGCRDAHLYAVDARTGARRWGYSTRGSWVISSPAAVDGRVYFGTGDSRRFIALDARTGAAVGSWPFSWYLFASPAIAGGLAYVAGWDGKLTAIDLATRRPVWTWQTDASRQHLAEFSKPDGSMRLRPEGSDPFYDELVTAVTRSFSLGSLLSSPVVVDGTLYIGSADGDVYALR
ncbi:MAG: PQQ-binding-like beta-propeller repeat protein [Gemmatimonadales bacterium]